MSGLVRAEYDLGTNVYGQRVRLVRERDSAGQEGWSIYRDPANQRDDSAVIRGLSKAQISYMATLVKGGE